MSSTIWDAAVTHLELSRHRGAVPGSRAISVAGAVGFDSYRGPRSLPTIAAQAATLETVLAQIPERRPESADEGTCLGGRAGGEGRPATGGGLVLEREGKRPPSLPAATSKSCTPVVASLLNPKANRPGIT